MCLIALAWRAHPAYRLIVAANRDEYFGRSSAPAAFWDDHRGVLAGRDLEAGGTWLGITLGGRFAALTNYRNPADRRVGVPSRGALVSDFLTGTTGPSDYAKAVARGAINYNGFSLLVGDSTSLWFVSNRGGVPAKVTPGRPRLVEPLAGHSLAQGRAGQGETGKAIEAALRFRRGLRDPRRHRRTLPARTYPAPG